MYRLYGLFKLNVYFFIISHEVNGKLKYLDLYSMYKLSSFVENSKTKKSEVVMRSS